MLYSAYGNMMQTKSRREALSYLNVMVVGASGSGKTAFVRTLCERVKPISIHGTYKESKPMALKGALQSTDQLYNVSMHVESDGQRIEFKIIDTPGFSSGFAVDQHLRYLCDYIEHQYEKTLAEESKVKRDAKASDSHIHACLYFLDTSQKGLSDVDRYMLKALSSRVNIIPIVSKADTLTSAERDELKQSFRESFFEKLNMPVYGYIDTDMSDIESNVEEAQHAENDTVHGETTSTLTRIIGMLKECVEEDHDEDAMAMITYLENLPLTVIGFEEDMDTGRPVPMMSSRDRGASAFHRFESEEDEPVSPNLSQDKNQLSTPTRPKPNRTNKGILGRRYPWAVVECFNPGHCDFEMLVDILISKHSDMLRIDTYERFYEQYRTNSLLNRKINRLTTIESRTGNKLLV